MEKVEIIKESPFLVQKKYFTALFIVIMAYLFIYKKD